jgi:MFS family permease
VALAFRAGPQDLRDGVQEAGATSMGRLAFASFIGTAIGFYDFYIYGTAAALAFATMFVFGGMAGDRVAQLLTYAGFAVAFVARPVGGAFFGHFGDRVGRKAVLIFSLLLMGLATFLIGCLPGYASIGIAAPVLLAVLRFVQGFGLGGSGARPCRWPRSTPPAAGAASTRASRRWARPPGSWWPTCSS